jgi:DNA-binding transcriptional regulator/RsmH inhibitor MraZ
MANKVYIGHKFRRVDKKGRVTLPSMMGAFTNDIFIATEEDDGSIMLRLEENYLKAPNAGGHSNRVAVDNQCRLLLPDKSFRGWTVRVVGLGDKIMVKKIEEHEWQE